MTEKLNGMISRVPDGEWFFYLADDEVLLADPRGHLESEPDFLTVKTRAANPANERATRYDPAAENFLYTRFVRKAADTRFVDFHWLLHHRGVTYNHYNVQLSKHVPEELFLREVW